MVIERHQLFKGFNCFGGLFSVDCLGIKQQVGKENLLLATEIAFVFPQISYLLSFVLPAPSRFLHSISELRLKENEEWERM